VHGESLPLIRHLPFLRLNIFLSS